MRVLALAIIGVGVATAVLIWLSLHLVHEAEKMERNRDCFAVGYSYGAVFTLLAQDGELFQS